MNVFITGGAGFIGSHLAKIHVENGDHVVIVDDLTTGSFDNIRSIKDKVAFEELGLSDYGFMYSIINEVDVVYHLAATVGYFKVLENPMLAFFNNVNTTKNILGLCATLKKKVLYTSSSEVYSSKALLPLTEHAMLNTMDPRDSSWSYAVSKLIGEFIGVSYHKTHDLDIVIARLFNTVGPRQSTNYGMVLPRFVKQCLLEEDITVFGDGSQTRTFIHVNDTAKWLYELMKGVDISGEVYNIGSDHEISIYRLARLVKETLNSKSSIVVQNHSEVYGEGFIDIKRRRPDISKIRNLFGVKPSTYTLESIIVDIADWMVDVL